MPSYRDRPVDQVRRKDRQLTDADWIERCLMQAPFGHLAVAYQGQPMIHMNLFWYDGQAIWFHTAPVGKLRAVVEAGATRACFSVAEIGRILPAGTPFDFSTEYASVLCYGTLAVVDEVATRRIGLEGLMTKYAPHLKAGVDYQSFLNVVIHRLPRGESIVSPRSRCTGCGREIRALENIPIVSFILLGGKCAGCGGGISGGIRRSNCSRPSASR